MAKFTFRLQSILNVKEQMEKNIKNELGIAMQFLQQQKDILQQIRNDILSQETEYREEVNQKTTLINLRYRLEFIKRLKKNEAAQILRVNEEKRNVDKVRERLIEAMKEKKVLENLKEKELLVFRKEQEKAEQLLVDELVSYKESTLGVKDEG